MSEAGSTRPGERRAGPAVTAATTKVAQPYSTRSPEQAKELLRLLVKDIQVHDRRRIIPTYRIPAAVRATPSKVGGTGLEPVTPSLSIRPRRSRAFAAVSSFSSLCRSFTVDTSAVLARVCAL